MPPAAPPAVVCRKLLRDEVGNWLVREEEAIRNRLLERVAAQASGGLIEAEQAAVLTSLLASAPLAGMLPPLAETDGAGSDGTAVGDVSVALEEGKAGEGTAEATAEEGGGSVAVRPLTAEEEHREGKLLFLRGIRQVLEEREEMMSDIFQLESDVEGVFQRRGDAHEIVSVLKSLQEWMQSKLTSSTHSYSTRKVLHGELQKRARDKLRWLRRWVVVRGHVLYYYRDRTETELKGELPLFDCVCYPTERKFGFVLTSASGDMTLQFQSKSEEERRLWMSTIQALSHSRGGASRLAELRAKLDLVTVERAYSDFLERLLESGSKLEVPVELIRDTKPMTNIMVTLRQAYKDISRDHVVISGTEFVGAHADDVLCHLSLSISRLAELNGYSMQQSSIVTFASNILVGCSRTTSGGDAFEAVRMLLGKSGVVMVCPLSEEASPLHLAVEFVAKRPGATTSKASRMLMEESLPIGNFDRVVWAGDTSSKSCFLCSAAFTVLRRRHHCRSCGKLVCSPCSKTTIYDRHSGSYVRVCDSCLRELTEERDSSTRDDLDSCWPVVTATTSTLYRVIGEESLETLAVVEAVYHRRFVWGEEPDPGKIVVSISLGDHGPPESAPAAGVSRS